MAALSRKGAGRGQGRAVNLPRRGSGQRGERHEGVGHHVAGQQCAEVLEQRLDRRRSVRIAGHDIRDDPPVARLATMEGDGGLVDLGEEARAASISPSSIRYPRSFTC